MDRSYWGKTFFGFFHTLFQHVVDAIQGNYHFADLAGDEVQVIALICIGISTSIVGSFLVLRKMAMVANAISHTVLLGIVSAFLILRIFYATPFSALLEVDMKLFLLAAILASLFTMALTDFLHNTLKLGRDASIGLVFTALFSLGIILVTIFTKNTHIGAEMIMGNVDMLHKDDILVSGALLLGNLLCLFLFFKEYVITSFDPGFAKISNISPTLFNYIVVLQTSLTLVGAFRAVGVVLVLALLVVPPVTARLFVHRIPSIILLSCVISTIGSCLAVALSRHILTVYGFSLSTSGLMVTILFLLWVCSLCYKLTLSLKRC